MHLHVPQHPSMLHLRRDAVPYLNVSWITPLVRLHKDHTAAPLLTTKALPWLTVDECWSPGLAFAAAEVLTGSAGSDADSSDAVTTGHLDASRRGPTAHTVSGSKY